MSESDHEFVLLTPKALCFGPYPRTGTCGCTRCGTGCSPAGSWTWFGSARTSAPWLQGLADIARHVIQRFWNPHLLSFTWHSMMRRATCARHIARHVIDTCIETSCTESCGILSSGELHLPGPKWRRQPWRGTTGAGLGGHWWSGLADSARHLIGCHMSKQTRIELRWMMWRKMGLSDIARHVMGCHLSLETRVQDA